jgi:2-polyprenyl-6-methoxyphenol hydroxylase-like FAD-dependent oxidoreductase
MVRCRGAFQPTETIPADGLVAADGLRCIVRSQVFSKQAVRYAGYTAWRAVVDFADSHNLI